jgi:1A family penicillin-binding protein
MRDTIWSKIRWFHIVGALLLILAAGGWMAWTWLSTDLPSPHTLYQRTGAPTTKIFDRKGRLLYEVMDPHGGKHTPVPLTEIPLVLRQATIATEDATFYANPGVDLKAVLRAIWINLRGGDVISGGSTITQQLARNLLLLPAEREQRTLTRKVRESILAFRLARAYTKDDILSLYLNEMYYGNLAYGVEAASKTYFGKSVRELDLAECALLAGLPQSPAAYDPLVDRVAAQRRQSTVLDLMVKAGLVDATEADLASQEQLHFASTPFPIEAPHFVMHVRRLLEERFGLEALYRGGLRVYTTLDLDMQNTAQDIVRRRLAALAERKQDQPLRDVRNAAVVALDPQTGEILTMLGSPDYFDPRIDGAVNATLATRQPGSSIKPLTYAVAFEQDYTPATMVLDVRTSFLTKEGEPYVPANYDRQFRGPVLLRDALASSFNLVAVKVLDHVGLNAMTGLARKLGITTFDDTERFGLALTLGGGEVRLMELSAAYAAFANGGRKVDPVAITRVDDASGRTLWSRPTGQGDQVVDPRIAYLITDILSDDTARVPGFGRDSVLNLSRPAAVKTGTTTDWRDNWTVGYTPDLVVGVWTGNADNEPMGHISGVTGAAPIWHDLMEAALQGRPVQPFVRPPGLVEAEVCADSGLLPTPDCLRRRTELFLEGTVPTKHDNLHQRIRIDRDTGELATANCPPERVIERVFTILPSEAQEWAKERHLPQPPVESCELHPEGGPPQDGGPALAHGSLGDVAPGRLMAEARPTSGPPPGRALVLTSPDQGSAFRVSPQIPLDDQCIEVAARPGDGVRLRGVTLLVDGVALSYGANPPYRDLWCLRSGEHRFQARGLDAAGQQIESQVVQVNVQ